jgi:hypothetical protein
LVFKITTWNKANSLPKTATKVAVRNQFRTYAAISLRAMLFPDIPERFLYPNTGLSGLFFASDGTRISIFNFF